MQKKNWNRKKVCSKKEYKGVVVVFVELMNEPISDCVSMYAQNLHKSYVHVPNITIRKNSNKKLSLSCLIETFKKFH